MYISVVKIVQILSSIKMFNYTFGPEICGTLEKMTHKLIWLYNL